MYMGCACATWVVDGISMCQGVVCMCHVCARVSLSLSLCLSLSPCVRAYVVFIVLRFVVTIIHDDNCDKMINKQVHKLCA